MTNTDFALFIAGMIQPLLSLRFPIPIYSPLSNTLGHVQLVLKRETNREVNANEDSRYSRGFDHAEVK